MPIYGHSPNRHGDWHLLGEHLEGTARRAASFGSSLGLADVAWWTGLWHDLGKGTCTFQGYLAAAAEDPKIAKARFPQRDHKTAGAAWAAQHGQPWAAFAIHGHHGGIPSAERLREVLSDQTVDPELLERVAKGLTTPIAPNGPVHWPGNPVDELGSEMFVRFLASCLVDADFLDTEAHFSAENDRTAPTLADVGLPALDRIADTYGSPSDAMGRARTRYRTHVVERARSAGPGVYRLTGATGVGKTVAGFAAAVEHALRNGQERVIIAVPYTTITEQVADVIRSLVPDEHGVLEHHSGVAEDNDTWWSRLAAQNWDAPIIVTTSVQLFESLFANRPSSVRKLHNLANAVVVLDEAQCLPTACLAAIVSALDWLVTDARSTVVLQTATQPAFDLVGAWNGRAFPDWGDIELGDVFDRVRWRHAGALTHEEVAAELGRREGSVLCVVNTVADAHRIGQALDGVTSLTTRLCPEHRRTVIGRVREDLSAGRLVRIVATQLVEAGVDLDFPAVWRAEGPLPSIAQVGGRCNRNATLEGLGDGVTFDLVGGRVPSGDYEAGCKHTVAARQHFGDTFNPEDPIVLRWWYSALYGHGLGHAPVQFDRSDEVQAARRALDFPETDKRFWMIDTQVPVIVAWGDPADRAKVDEIVARLHSRIPVGREAMRFLARFTVTLNVGTANRFHRAGLIDQVESRTDGTGLLLGRWLGTYDDTFGLLTGDDDRTGAVQW